MGQAGPFYIVCARPCALHHLQRRRGNRILLDMIGPRSRSMLLSALVGSLTAACDCDQVRSATFTGHLGDSTIAVGFFPTVPGGTEVSVSEFNPKATHRTQSNSFRAKVNFSTFADSVAFIRVSDFNDAARIPIVSFAKSLGSRSADVFQLERGSDDLETFEKLWNVLAKGDGMLEVQPHQGQIVRARLKPLDVHGWHNYCT